MPIAHALDYANSPAYGCSLAWQNRRGVPNSPAGRRVLDVASFLSHKSFSGGGSMVMKRRRVKRTEDWERLELLCVHDEQVEQATGFSKRKT